MDPERTEHLLPMAEAQDHTTRGDQCPCKPFAYIRTDGEGDFIGYEVRHNSFDALPVPEDVLEKVQQEAQEKG